MHTHTHTQTHAYTHTHTHTWTGVNGTLLERNSSLILIYIYERERFIVIQSISLPTFSPQSNEEWAVHVKKKKKKKKEKLKNPPLSLQSHERGNTNIYKDICKEKDEQWYKGCVERSSLRIIA